MFETAPGLNHAPIFEMNGTELQDRIQEKDFALVLGGSISGRAVRKDDGEGVANARIVVAVGRMFGGGRRGGSAEEQQAGTGRATTAEDGTFRARSRGRARHSSISSRASTGVPGPHTMLCTTRKTNV